MKRILVGILLLIVNFTTFTPCCIDDNCAAEITASGGNEKEESSQQGLCSPFSSCSVCSGFISIEMTIRVLPVSPPPVQHLESAYPGSLPSFYTPVWQPPREMQCLSA